eukprot:scaffold311778_cov26-Prasinocladus_malaysianus.AAC.1
MEQRTDKWIDAVEKVGNKLYRLSCDASDAKLVGSLDSLLIHPSHVLLSVGIECLAYPLVAPLDQVCVFDAVRCRARGFRQCAKRELCLKEVTNIFNCSTLNSLKGDQGNIKAR